MKPISLYLWCQECSERLDIGEDGALGPWMFYESQDQENFSAFVKAHDRHKVELMKDRDTV